MKELLQGRRTPFVVAAILIALVTVAVFRLPESLITELENRSPFTLSQRGWIFRLLGAFAVVQAVYVGFGILRAERVAEARSRDPRVATLPHERLMRSLARNSVAAIAITIGYGIISLAFTGLRAGFWLFVFVALLQGAWYYRQTGEIARWLVFQPDVAGGSPSGWRREPSDYCPPLTRGLQPVETPPPDH